MSSPLSQLDAHLSNRSRTLAQYTSGYSNFGFDGSNDKEDTLLRELTMDSELNHYRSRFKTYEPLWSLTHSQMTGKIINLSNTSKFLPRKATKESKLDHQQRLMYADFKPMLIQSCMAVSGQILQRESDTERDYGALGNVDDEKATAIDFYRDADSKGNSFYDLLDTAATMLAGYNEIWVLYQGGVMTLIPPHKVMDWEYDGSQYSFVKTWDIVEIRDPEDDEFSPLKMGLVYNYYYPDRHETYQHKRDKDNELVTDKEGKLIKDWVSTNYYKKNKGTFETRKGKPTCPLFRIELNSSIPIGPIMAKKGLTHFILSSLNTYSRVDSNHPMLVISPTGDGGVAEFGGEDDRVSSSNYAISKGSPILPSAGSGSGYIEFPYGNVSKERELLDKDAQDFMVDFFHTADSTSRGNPTATEIQYESLGKSSPFISLVAKSKTQIEIRVLNFIEQELLTKDQWWKVKVKRPSMYLRPIDNKDETETDDGNESSGEEDE